MFLYSITYNPIYNAYNTHKNYVKHIKKRTKIHVKVTRKTYVKVKTKDVKMHASHINASKKAYKLMYMFVKCTQICAKNGHNRT